MSLSMQNDVIESRDISNVSIKELLSHNKIKQGVTQFLQKQVVNHLLSQDICFVVAGNGKTHIKNSNSTVDVASNNHDGK